MSRRPSDPNTPDHSRRNPAVRSCIDEGRIDLSTIASAQAADHDDTLADDGLPEDTGAAAYVRRGRPSVAEAEALSGRILDASWDVLLTGGFENFTFDRVARHAHIGKATIYSRFPGKTELMRALLLRRIEMRSDHFKTSGSHLEVEAAFCLRAAETMKNLFSPGGALMERLIDWLEQETGEGQRMRVQAYRNAIESIGNSLANAHTLDGISSSGDDNRTFADPSRAARLWLEGLIGHAKLAYTEGASSPAEIERWASDYTRFFFAGLRAIAAD
jgi:AcrR family transcriptional regulator